MSSRDSRVTSGSPLMPVSTFSAPFQVVGSTRFFHIDADRRRVEIEYTWTDLKKLRARERERLASS